MDDLRYFSEDRVDEQLPAAWKQFDKWSQAQKDTDVLEELRQNIRGSNREQQLIKLKFIELAAGEKRVITVNPEVLRHGSEGIRFHELIEEQFDVGIRHILIVPSLPRYQLNLFYRGRLKKTDRGFEERALLRSKIHLFECVLHVGLFTGSQGFARQVLNEFSLEEHH